MAILIFPAIAPNYLRSITLPDYKILVKEFEDGGEYRRTAQTVGAGTLINLSYELITHVEAATLINFWASTKGTWLSFTLPTVIIQHPDNIRQALIKLDSTLLWRFSDSLQIKTDYATLQRSLYSFDVNIQSVVS
jgi:hypothetical protein